MIKDLMMEICELTLKINEQGNHNIFFNIQPHVFKISTRVFEGKWLRNKDPDLELDCYYDSHFAENRLKEMILELNKYLEVENE